MSDTDTVDASPADDTADTDPVEEPKQGLPDDPAVLRKEIDKLRKEAAGYRTKAKELEPLAVKARELEDAQKTEAERVAERLAAAERAQADAERRALLAEVRAERPDLTATQVARLQGDSIDDLVADAAEVYGVVPEQAAAAPKRRPSELTPGAVPGAEPEPDFDAIVDKIRRR